MGSKIIKMQMLHKDNALISKGTLPVVEIPQDYLQDEKMDIFWYYPYNTELLLEKYSFKEIRIYHE